MEVQFPPWPLLTHWLFSAFLLSGVAAPSPLGCASRPLPCLEGLDASPLVCHMVSCVWEGGGAASLLLVGARLSTWPSDGARSGGGEAQRRRAAAGSRPPSGLHEPHRGSGQGSRGVACPSSTPWVEGVGSLVDSSQSGEGRCLSFLRGPCWQGWRRHRFPVVSGRSSQRWSRSWVSC